VKLFAAFFHSGDNSLKMFFSEVGVPLMSSANR
jgi:hypothetical protein